MFLKPSEHIIIMDDDTYISLDTENLKRLEDAGIETVMLPHALNWQSNADKQLEPVLKTNLKAIIPFFYGFPDLWYASGMDEAIDEFAHTTLEYYKDLRSRVQFIYGIPEGGEFLWDAYKTKDFPLSDEAIAKFIVGRQKILFQQHGEIWMCLHHFLGHPMNWNNNHISNVYQAIRDEFPDAPFYSVQFAHFAVGNSKIVEPTLFMKDIIYQERFNMKIFVGSEFCNGLKTNYAEHKRQGLWGFITAPLHTQNKSKPKSVEGWMVDIIRETNHKLNEAWQ